MRIVATVILLALAAPQAKGERLQAHLFESPNGGASLSFYEWGCSYENLPECWTADLGCDTYRGTFRASIGFFSEREVSAWLKATNGIARLSIGRAKFALKSSNIEFSDMNGAWDIAFRYHGNEGDLWKSLATARRVSLAVGNRRISHNEKNQIRKLVELCNFRKLYYGSRAGMSVTVLSMTGIDSENSVITTEHTRDDAIGYCRDYVGQVDDACIREALSLEFNDSVSANCSTGEFVDFFGDRWRYEGTLAGQGPKYALRNLSLGEVADGSHASGYPTQIEIFKALCPSSVPGDPF